MRFILFLLVTLIFTACGHQKIRFSRVKQKQKVVEISEIPSLKKSETAFVPQTEVEEAAKENSLASTEVNDSEKSIEESTISTEEEIHTDFPETAEDSVVITAEDADYMTQEALRAEKLGTWSMITGIAAPSSFVLAFLLLWFALSGGFNPLGIIVSVVLAISVIVNIILSYVFGAASLRAQYNTPKGRKRAITGIAVSSAFLFLYLILFVVGLF